METKKISYYKDALKRKKLSLAEMVQRSESYGREQEPDTQDVADMAVESYTREFLFGKSSGDRALLRLIDQALGRIEDNTYGSCVHCENPIHPRRLEAVPWTPHCIQCQSLLEKGLLDN